MVAIMEQVVGEVFNIVARNPQAAPSSTISVPFTSTTPSPPAQTTTQAPSNNNSPTSSPLLFFVALGFGVVFTNLWIIVGVKYCFRYNARNRALRNGEDIDQVNMEAMPARPHRRRKEKKLMTMDEVNERFPLTKYKNWVANRMSAGLPAAGGVTAPPSRAGSVRNVDGVMPSSPVDTKHSINTRPATATSEVDVSTAVKSTDVSPEQKKENTPTADKDTPTSKPAEAPKSEDLTEPVGRHLTTTSLEEDDDDDDHIHTAVPPELLTNPGDSCAICIDSLEDDDDIRGLTCGHAFHAGCLDPWLTSRRACCPLCKADYYTPKPRPEGEQIDLTDRAARRREARMNMPQEPRSAWAGFRGAARTVLPTRRYESGTFRPEAVRDEDRRASRRQRRAAAETQAQQPQVAGQNERAPEFVVPLRNRIRNPFSSIHMPAIPRLAGRGRPAGQSGTEEPSPSQLEAGTTSTGITPAR